MKMKAIFTLPVFMLLNCFTSVDGRRRIQTQMLMTYLDTKGENYHPHINNVTGLYPVGRWTFDYHHTFNEGTIRLTDNNSTFVIPQDGRYRFSGRVAFDCVKRTHSNFSKIVNFKLEVVERVDNHDDYAAVLLDVTFRPEKRKIKQCYSVPISGFMAEVRRGDSIRMVTNGIVNRQPWTSFFTVEKL